MHQLAVNHNPATDARAYGYVDCRVAILQRAQRHLCERCRIYVEVESDGYI